MSATVEFFYDFSCPFAYLGATRIEEVCAAAGANLVWRPFHLGGLFRDLYGAETARPPTPIAPKASHAALDLRRWADHFGVPLAYPPGHPFRTADCLRSVLVATEAAAALTHRIYRAYWVEHRDVGDRAVLRTLLTDVGADADHVLDRVSSEEIRQRLRDNTDEARERGVFGAPTCFIDGDFMVWGQDRLHFVEAAAKGWRPTDNPREDT